VLATIKALNPAAKVIQSVNSKIDAREIIGTNAFDIEKAQVQAGTNLEAPIVRHLVSLTPFVGWLRSMNEEIKPESEEYGVSSFVYRQRRPFHPERYQLP